MSNILISSPCPGQQLLMERALQVDGTLGLDTKVLRLNCVSAVAEGHDDDDDDDDDVHVDASSPQLSSGVS